MPTANYILTSEESKTMSGIVEKYYMPPVIKKLDGYISKLGLIKTFNYLHEIITSCESEVEVFLDGRIKSGEIKDKSQARKSIVGNIFPSCIVYLFLKSKQERLIRKDIFITTKTKGDMFKSFVTIFVDGETQKPDMDLLIYSLNSKSLLNNLMIISLKTSLRERAGQTYKWKLLMEIASGSNQIKDKYNIIYNPPKMPLVCFATINFYNEINNPQHKGMFKFFDNSFIGKPLKEDFIDSLDKLIEFVNSRL
jgi:type II restriction enzyme